ncbi:MAG: Na/Pi cotransporter family protein [Clostridia bacterium]|nr:Na/Pi cotransporter family protein [Clostridia bacterium]MDD7673092.1 Na/Pi cotransporter family protein [Clostridia bacterium]MDY2929439.1 Na/Pi cotransporter family protein [Clostridiaceae bacterium]
MDIFSVITLMGGLTFFLFGMNVMSGSLEKMAGGRLEEMLRKMTASPWISMVLGAVITIAVQSSSATTVMLVGLVNSGIMQFSQTINIIFGANIGTTLTAWITSLSGIQSDVFWIQMLKPKNFSPLLAFAGILMIMLSRKETRKSIGTVFVGFAVLMYGMEMMAGAVSPLADMPEFEMLLVKFQNPIVGVLVGTLFTGVIQSSAASIGILQALSLTGGITYGMAIPIVMGQNIGTCATSLISCIGTNVKAKRVAILHVSIKIIGTILCLSGFELLYAIFRWEFVSQSIAPWQIALVHTIFNLATTALLMPVSQKLVKLTERLVRDKQRAPAEPEDAMLLDDRLLRSPSVAVAESFNVSTHMALQAQDILMLAMHLVEQYDPEGAQRVMDMEDQLDNYEDKLGTYLVKLSAQALSSQDSQIGSKILHAIGDFERLGDHAINIIKVAREIHEKKIVFSPAAQQELTTIVEALDEILDITVRAYLNSDVELAGRVEPLEQVIDRLTSVCKDNHIRRLQKGACTIEGGFVLSDLLNNYERISDHCSNVAVAIIEVEHNSFDTHKYLNGVKYGNSTFNEIYDAYSEKYVL